MDKASIITTSALLLAARNNMDQNATATSDLSHYAEATEKKTFDGTYSPNSVIVTLAVAISLYNSLEMILLLTSTFKKWKGLYFWSLTISNFGVMLYSLGMMLGYFDLCVLWLSKVILDIGWIAMVVFQSLVLYSRLNLILQNWKILQAVKWMIITNSFVLCIFVVVFDFGTTYSKHSAFSRGYYYIELIQMTFFTTQELIISFLYVWKTLAFLRVLEKEQTRTMIWQLFGLNVLIISMDIGLVTLEYLHYQLYQEAIKAFVYSVKLKLELNILSKLVDLVSNNKKERSMTLATIDATSIAGQSQADVRREMSWQGHSNDPFKHDEKAVLRKVNEGNDSGGSSTGPHDESDGISRVSSGKRWSTARTSGRDADIMYADMLSSIK